MDNESGILIAGGSGLVGTALAHYFSEKGYTVKILSRSKKASKNIFYYWNPDAKEIDAESLQGIGVLINLSGANIAEKKWTAERKKHIKSSRTKSALFLKEVLENNTNCIKHIIAASATGFYGAVTNKKIYDETFPPATDFLGKTCQSWEDANNKLGVLAEIYSVLRISTVLSDKGGALPKIATPIKMGVGSKLASGKQIMPWIHIEDLCRMFEFVIETKLAGTFNACSNDYCTNKTLTKTIASILKRPLIAPPVPRFMLKAIFGELSVLLLEGAAVSSKKIIDAGFEFSYPTIESAIKSFYQ